MRNRWLISAAKVINLSGADGQYYAEYSSLATGAAVITLELASRFLGDYLTGDKYFRIDYPEHNLVRARAQLALYKDMMVHMEDMQNIVRELAG